MTKGCDELIDNNEEYTKQLGFKVCVLRFKNG